MSNKKYIHKLNVGEKGVAIATFIAQSISAILSLFFLLKKIKDIYKRKKSANNIKIFDLDIFKSMCKISGTSTFNII